MFFKTSDFNPSMLAKWALSLILPLGVYLLLPRDGSLSQPMMAFLAITLWAVCAWAMDTLNEIAVGILLPALYILFCGVGMKVVYSPWLSEVPIIVIGGFILGKIIQDTGLDNLLFPYEYALYLYFFSSGYINFKEMLLVMAIRIVLAGAFVAFVAVPYWRLVL